MKRILTIALLLFTASGAFAQTRFVSTNGQSEHVKATSQMIESVSIYFEKENVPPWAERIGLITSREKSRNKAYKKSKKVCASHGGTALLLTEAHDMTSGDKWGKALVGGRSFNGNYEFIVYKIKPKEKE